MDGRKIAEAKIVGRKTGIPMLDAGVEEVHVTLDDGTETKLFEYYIDELRFTADEFVGLTVEEARKLHFDRDMAYLRS